MLLNPETVEFMYCVVYWFSYASAELPVLGAIQLLEIYAFSVADVPKVSERTIDQTMVSQLCYDMWLHGELFALLDREVCIVGHRGSL